MPLDVPDGGGDCDTPELPVALTVLDVEREAKALPVGEEERHRVLLALLVPRAALALTGAEPVRVKEGEREAVGEALAQGLAEAAAESLACPV